MSRLRISLIKNRRRRALAGFEHGLASRCGIVRPVYLPIEESLRLYGCLEESITPDFNTGRIGRPQIESSLQTVQHSSSDEECIVFLHHHWFIGGIKMPLPVFWAKALALLDFDGDTVFAVSPDATQKLLLDYDASPADQGGGYDLWAFGERWSRLR